GWPSSAGYAADAPIEDAGVLKNLHRRLSSLNIDLSDMRSSGEITDQAKFKDFFNGALDVIRSPANDDFPKYRVQYFSKPLQQSGNAPSKAFHDELNKFLLENCPKLAEDPALTPASQINAAIILADLNSKELAVGGRGTVVPLAAALPVLMDLYKTGKSEAVRAVALAGMVRHAEGGSMSKDMQSKVGDEMLKTLATATPPKGRSADAQLWFRRRACEALGYIGDPGDGNDPSAVVKALTATIAAGGESRLLPLRCDAANALAKLKITPALNVNYAQLGGLLAQLAVDVARDETVTTQAGLRSMIVPVDNALHGTLATQRLADAKRLAPGGLTTLAAGTPHEEYIKSLADQLQPMIDLTLADDFSLEQARKDADDLETWIGDNPVDGEAVAAN
ncbi:MAG: hypothetical protein AB7O62_15775, partial [Pirellulales bacterium]